MRSIPPLFLLLFSHSLAAQQKVSRSKTLLITGTSVVSVAGLYVYLHEKWWAEQSRHFRFDHGRDLRYANNLDKMGHLMGGLMTADAYVDACHWIGMSERQSAWWGFGMSAGLQTLIELKDGFSPNYGFSVFDITAGALGAMLPVARLESKFFRHTDIKFSYWQRTQKYFNARPIPVRPFHIDDYLNQTYWMSTNLRYLLGEKAPWVPDWLNLCVGWGIDADTWNTNRADPGTGGKAELYLAPDIDLVRLFKPKKAFWKLTLKRLNYLKVPMPTLQLTPKVKGWAVYF